MMKNTREYVELLYRLITQETGGSVGLRDATLLDSALGSIFQTFNEKELYPTIEEKGARLGFNLISNHAFLDGNKRIAATMFLYFLDKNGILYDAEGKKMLDDHTLVALTIMIAESRPEEKEMMISVIMNCIG